MPGLIRGSDAWLVAMNAHYYQDPDVMFLIGYYEAMKEQEQANGNGQQEGRIGTDDEWNT